MDEAIFNKVTFWACVLLQCLFLVLCAHPTCAVPCPAFSSRCHVHAAAAAFPAALPPSIHASVWLCLPMPCHAMQREPNLSPAVEYLWTGLVSKAAVTVTVTVTAGCYCRGYPLIIYCRYSQNESERSIPLCSPPPPLLTPPLPRPEKGPLPSRRTPQGFWMENSHPWLSFTLFSPLTWCAAMQ